MNKWYKRFDRIDSKTHFILKLNDPQNPEPDTTTQDLFKLPMQQTPKPDAQVPDGLPPTFEQSVEL